MIRLTESAASTPVRREKGRVLFIIDQLCEMGGAERALLGMVRCLPRDRFVPYVATFKIDNSLPVFLDFPCSLTVLPLRRTWDLQAVRVAVELNRLIRRERINIVHTFFETADLWAALIAHLSGVRGLISSRRDMGILRSRKHRVAYRFANTWFDEIHTVSEQVRQYCIRHDRVNPRKVITVYNGVTLPRTDDVGPDALPDVLQHRDYSHVITTVAHIRKVKGIDLILRTAFKVVRQFPKALFLCVGENHDPDCFTALIKLRAELGLERHVVFAGNAENVFPILQASDVFCLLSRSEGLSNAILEAMAVGLPCVVSDVGGNPELIRNHEQGFLIPNEDVDGAAAAITDLLANPSLAKRMGTCARTLIHRQFTTDAMMHNVVQSYERLLG